MRMKTVSFPFEIPSNQMTLIWENIKELVSKHWMCSPRVTFGQSAHLSPRGTSWPEDVTLQVRLNSRVKASTSTIWPGLKVWWYGGAMVVIWSGWWCPGEEDALMENSISWKKMFENWEWDRNDCNLILQIYLVFERTGSCAEGDGLANTLKSLYRTDLRWSN